MQRGGANVGARRWREPAAPSTGRRLHATQTAGMMLRGRKTRAGMEACACQRGAKPNMEEGARRLEWGA